MCSFGGSHLALTRSADEASPVATVTLWVDSIYINTLKYFDPESQSFRAILGNRFMQKRFH